MTELNVLSIDYIKKNQTRMYNFGLGFIQVVFSPSTRAHYYTDKIPQLNDEIHNHRYNFTSRIIKGHFIQNKYNLVPGDTHLLTNESCNKEREVEHNIAIPVGVDHVSSEHYYTGDVYNIFYNEFHNVYSKDDTITLLNRTNIITDFAQVLLRKDQEKVCPFSNRMSEDDLYQIIESVIKS